MKAYRIQNDIVAAHNEPQAIGTWAHHFGKDWRTAGPAEEVNPAEVEVQYEQRDGSFQPGPLTEMMPDDNADPEVLIEGECEHCG